MTATRYALIAHALADVKADLFALESCDWSALADEERKARLAQCDGLYDELSTEQRCVVQRD